jgi:hypothetical protein
MVKPLAITLTVIGGLLLLLAVLYMSMKASSLPSFFPGHLPVRVTKRGHTIQTHTHVKLGAVLLIAAVGVLGATWWLAFRYEPAD